MRKDLPKEINEALEILWKYADDACLSGMTKEEFDAEGYEIKEDSAYYVRFALPKLPDDKWHHLKQATANVDQWPDWKKKLAGIS